ncbi:MAG: hypothetical protein FJ125_02170, partial [Deltaproteobacteria bacterium]|nr:hypothetical protein [Deltaproteobacteria bacterium]
MGVFEDAMQLAGQRQSPPLPPGDESVFEQAMRIAGSGDPPAPDATADEKTERRSQQAAAFRAATTKELKSTIRQARARGFEQLPAVAEELRGIASATAGTEMGQRVPVGPLPAPERGLAEQAFETWRTLPLNVPAIPVNIALQIQKIARGEKELDVVSAARIATAQFEPVWHLVEQVVGKPEVDQQTGIPIEKPVDRSAVSVAGQVLSTGARPLAALLRGVAENELARRQGTPDQDGQMVFTDPQTGASVKEKTGAEIFSDVMRSASPLPATNRDNVSYIDVARAMSQAAGGTGDEWYVYLPGFAADVAFDPTTYLTIGGGSMSRLGGRQVQRIAMRALDDISEATKVGQAVSMALRHFPSEQVLEDTARMMQKRVGGVAGDKVAGQIRDLGAAFGRSGLNVAGREVVSAGAFQSVAQTVGRTFQTEVLAAAQRFDALVEAGGKGLPGPLRRGVEAIPRGAGTRAYRAASDSLDALWKFVTTEPRPLAGNNHREVLSIAAQQENELAAGTSRAEREMVRIATGGKRTLREREQVAPVIELGHALAFRRRKAGEMYNPDEMDVILGDASFDKLDPQQHRDLGLMVERAYASAIYQGTDGASAAVEFERRLTNSLHAAFDKEQAAAVAERLKTSAAFARWKGNLGTDWAAYDTAYKQLDDGLRTIVQWIGKEHETMLAEEQAAGVPIDEMFGYMMHMYRNRKPLQTEAGLRSFQPGTERVLRHRTVLSLEEAQEIARSPDSPFGLDPLTEAFQMLAARRYAHGTIMQQHNFMNRVLGKFGQALAVKDAEAAKAKVSAMRNAGQQVDWVNWRGKFYTVDAEVGEAIGRVGELWKPPNFSQAARWFDRIHGWWKMRATAGRLGFHTRNLFSDFWNMMLGGFRNPANFGRAFNVGLVGHHLEDTRAIEKAMRPPGYKESALDRLTDKWRGKLAEMGERAAQKIYEGRGGARWTGKELYEQAEKLGVMDKGWLSMDVQRSLLDTVGTARGYSLARSVMGTANPFGRDWMLVKWGGKAGRARENQIRLTFFLDRVLSRGESPADAARHVKRFLFDYKDLAPGDRMAKRVVPF